MLIRRATSSDLTSMAETFSDAFDNGVSVSTFAPYRREFRADFVRALRQRLVEDYWDYSGIMMVACEDSTTGSQPIIGFSQWRRVGLGAENVWGARSWDPRRLIRPLLRTFHRIHRWFFPNRAMTSKTIDGQRLTLFNFEASLMPFIGHIWTETPYRVNHWELCVLGVQPESQGKGVGRQLVAWGLEQAKRDSVSVSVVASGGKERFYQRCGFHDIVGWVHQGTDKNGRVNPLQRLGLTNGGAILWTRQVDDVVPEKPVATEEA